MSADIVMKELPNLIESQRASLGPLSRLDQLKLENEKKKKKKRKELGEK